MLPPPSYDPPPLTNDFSPRLFTLRPTSLNELPGSRPAVTLGSSSFWKPFQKKVSQAAKIRQLRLLLLSPMPLQVLATQVEALICKQTHSVLPLYQLFGQTFSELSKFIFDGVSRLTILPLLQTMVISKLNFYFIPLEEIPNEILHPTL